VSVVPLGCASGPSPRGQRGGVALPLDAAYWSRARSTVEVRPDGRVFDDDKLLLHIDRHGRLENAEGEPIAVLMPDGSLVAEDDSDRGQRDRLALLLLEERIDFAAQWRGRALPASSSRIPFISFGSSKSNGAQPCPGRVRSSAISSQIAASGNARRVNRQLPPAARASSAKSAAPTPIHMIT
jgi:hypothetical protein